jgi:hypothetical protein
MEADEAAASAVKRERGDRMGGVGEWLDRGHRVLDLPDGKRNLLPFPPTADRAEGV